MNKLENVERDKVAMFQKISTLIDNFCIRNANSGFIKYFFIQTRSRIFTVNRFTEKNEEMKTVTVFWNLSQGLYFSTPRGVLCICQRTG